VHPITAVQSEYSLWTREYEANTIPVCRELGIGYVAYYALGRGFLSGKWRDFAQLGETEAKRRGPRFHEQNFSRNVSLLKGLQQIADSKKMFLRATGTGVDSQSRRFLRADSRHL
jgi:aryl-alcohol dehydrogenase-like predicted oxidoreductase